MQKIDLVTGIIEYESGEMDEATIIEFFKQHKDTLIGLQGHYGRTIAALEDAGLI